jgi:diacylglycerol kinase family enzyme
MPITLFHNPGAGAKVAKKELLAALELAGIPATYCSTKSNDFANVLKEPADLIFVAGGDGTVAEVVTRMPDRSIPVAILPVGTANNIARSFGIAGAPLQLVEAFRPDHWQRLDIGLARGPWGSRRFVEAVGFGPFARAMRELIDDDDDGAERLRNGRRTLGSMFVEASPLDITLRLDGKPLKGDFMAIEIANTTYTGPGLPLAPAGAASDGLLDVIAVEGPHLGDMLSWIAAPQQSAPPVPLRQARKVSISFQGASLRLDDEVLDAPRGESIAIELEPEPVKVLVPVQSAEQRAKSSAGAAAKGRLPPA